MLFNAGWILLQNPYISESLAVEFNSALRPTKAQVGTVFNYMIHFDRHNFDRP